MTPRIWEPVKLDEIYPLCLETAKTSTCAKLKFGAVLLDKEYRFVTAQSNRPIAPLQRKCEGTCIRKTIPSRTHSMLGACAHAEEWALREARIMGISTFAHYRLFIAGTNFHGVPLVRTDGEFTCIRCAVQMYMHELGEINVYRTDQERWVAQSAYAAVLYAYEYAVQAKIAHIST